MTESGPVARVAPIRRLALLLALPLAGCGAIDYYWQGIAGQLELLVHAKPVSEVAGATGDESLRERLRGLQAIRAFASSDLALAIEAGATRLHVPVFLAARASGDRPASTIDALSHQLAQLQLARLERELAELRARRPHALTVHLYRGKLGSEGSHGFLDLRRDRIAALIEHGREAALHHDCQAAGCLLGEA